MSGAHLSSRLRSPTFSVPRSRRTAPQDRQDAIIIRAMLAADETNANGDAT